MRYWFAMCIYALLISVKGCVWFVDIVSRFEPKQKRSQNEGAQKVFPFLACLFAIFGTMCVLIFLSPFNAALFIYLFIYLYFAFCVHWFHLVEGFEFKMNQISEIT